MANYSTLKAAVADVVKTNGTQAITGVNLQSVLLSIINSVGGGGYIFNGVATPSTGAGTPDQNVFYIGSAGTYANFGTSVTVPVGSIGVFKYNGSWVKEQIALFAGIDDAPTAGSDNLVKSGGVDFSIKKLYSQTIKTLDLLTDDNVYQIVNGTPVLLESTNWRHKLISLDKLAEISVWCTNSIGIGDTKIPGIIYLSGDSISDYISCEYAEGVSGIIYNKNTIDAVPSNATHCILQTSVSRTSNIDYCIISKDLASDVTGLQNNVNNIKDKLERNVKTLDLLTDNNVYQIVDDSPVLLESTSWRHKLLKIEDIDSISVWCTRSTGVGDLKIPGIIYLSGDSISDYISCEYAAGSDSIINKNTIDAVPSNATHCILQTSVSRTTDNDYCRILDDIISDITSLQGDVENLQSYIGINSQTLIVNKSGDTGTYLTLAAAMTAANNGDTILMYDGVYEEYHVELKRGVRVVGIGQVEIRGYLPTDTADFATLVTSYSTLEASDGCDMENITVTARNLRYPIHAQSSASNKPCVWTLKNCKFIHYGNSEAYDFLGAFAFRAISAWGCGTNGGDKIFIDGCTFISNMRAFSIHNANNQNNASTLSKGSLYAEINNSTFISLGIDQDGTKHEFNDVIHIQSLWSKTPDIVLFNGCNANGYLVWHIDIQTGTTNIVPTLETYISGTNGLLMAFNSYGGINNSFTDLTQVASQHLDYYPKINGEIEEWVNTGEVNIPRGYCVAKSDNYGVKLWDNTCNINDFIGIALDDINVNTAGNIKVRNYIHKIYAGFAYNTSMNVGDKVYIDNNGKPTLTQSSFEIGEVVDNLGNIKIIKE